jgi:hypothetical protein
MMERNKSSEKHSESKARMGWYRILLLIVPALIPLIYLYFSGKQSWPMRHIAMVAAFFAVYWLTVLVIAARVLRHKRLIKAVNLASPLIELPLSSELRAKLSRFAAAKQQKLTVAAFEILDQEIPRFEQDEERNRARLDNEQLRQQTGQGAFLVAVTTEILKRLLLLSGAQEQDRKVWRSHISETAARIVNDALDHRLPATEG